MFSNSWKKKDPVKADQLGKPKKPEPKMTAKEAKSTFSLNGKESDTNG